MLIPVGDVELAVERHGDPDRPVLLLVHGFTGSAGDWAGVVDALAERRHVVTMEHRGHGASTNTGDEATYRFDQLVDDLAGLLDALVLDPIDLLGHSMGGIVAMRYALRHPERLRSLILMDTGAAASPDSPSAGFMRAGFDIARDGGMAAVLASLERFLPDDEEGAQTRAQLRHNYASMDVAAFVALGEELLTHESVLDQLASLAVPTTVIVGEHDNGLRGPSYDLAMTIPGAELEVIADAAHSPQIEARDAWLAAVGRHLDRTA